jgi:hypothetical protein
MRVRLPLVLCALPLAWLHGGCGTNESRVFPEGPIAVLPDVQEGDSETLPPQDRPDGGSDGEAETSGEDGAGTDPPAVFPPVPGGGDCQSNLDCPRGLVCLTDIGRPFCGPAPDASGSNCSTEADCAFEDSADRFCCAGYFGTRRCTRAGDPADGARCGAGEGVQGESCTVGGQSDCDASGASCLFEGTDYAYCAELCVGPIFGCPTGSWCFRFAPGDPNGLGLCVEQGDTPALDSCVDDPTSCERGTFCVLADQDDPLAFCAAACGDDRPCPSGQACNFFGICEPAGPRGVGENCSDDRFACAAGLFCANAGTRIAQCIAPCDGPRDCPSGTRCLETAPGQSFCVREGDRRQGDSCADDPLSCAGICNAGYERYEVGALCVDSCRTNAECGPGLWCQDFGPEIGRYCQGDGEGGQGADCSLDFFACRRDHFCFGYGTSNAVCIRRCSADSDCGADSWCVPAAEGEDRFCLPRGNTPAGGDCRLNNLTCEEGSICGGTVRPRCFAYCDREDGCTGGERCIALEDGPPGFCFPFGDRIYGDACGDEPYACAFPTFCAEPGVAQARCTIACTRDAECPDTDWCYRGTDDSNFCRPAGAVGPLGSCEGDLYACQAGLTCLRGAGPGALCTRECTGFPGRCGRQETCAFVGWGRSMCLPAGTATHGASCEGDAGACAPGHWCAGAGLEGAVCVATCSFSRDACPESSTCRFLPSGLGLCLGAGLQAEDPLNPGGRPR